MGKVIIHSDDPIIGTKFGRLTVIGDSGKRTSSGNILWDCLCDCGNHRLNKKSDLRRGCVLSCGCYQKENLSDRSKKYNTWIEKEDCYIGIATNNNLKFMISKEDYEKCKNIGWFTNYDKHTDSYYLTSSKEKTMTRYILDENDPNVFIDHINHNTLDNRRKNLRKVTISQNSMNRKVMSTNSSGITGVRWHKATQKWQADLCINKKTIYLGIYSNIEDAIKARKEAEERYFRQYSYENSMREEE